MQCCWLILAPCTAQTNTEKSNRATARRQANRAKAVWRAVGVHGDAQQTRVRQSTRIYQWAMQWWLCGRRILFYAAVFQGVLGRLLSGGSVTLVSVGRQNHGVWWFSCRDARVVTVLLRVLSRAQPFLCSERIECAVEGICLVEEAVSATLEI